MKELTAKNHAEAVAHYRAEIIGSLTKRDLDRGELQKELETLSKKRFRPPRAHGTRCYGVSTLERWYYKYKEGSLEALCPRPRADRGRGRELTPEQRELLCAIRQEHPSASVPLIVQTLTAEGRIDNNAAHSAAEIARLHRLTRLLA